MKTSQDIQALLTNPEIFEINRLKAHSDHRYYQTLEEAMNKSEMSWRQCLNGEWLFKYSENFLDKSGVVLAWIGARGIKLHRLSMSRAFSCGYAIPNPSCKYPGIK